MWLNELYARCLGRLATGGRISLPSPRRPRQRLTLELLEDRAVPANFIAASAADLIADINAANQTVESDTITLVAGRTFTLIAVDNTTDGPTGLPVIAANENLTILGSGDTIERSSVTGTPAFRLFDVSAGGALTLANLTLQGGLALGAFQSFQSAPWSYGGAVYSQGALTLDGVTVQNNTAQGTDGFQSFGGPISPGIGAGGGLFATGALTMTNSTIQNNMAIGGRGINAGWVVFDTSLETWPSGPGGSGLGGGLYVGGTVAIRSSIVTGNTARGGAGGSGLSEYHRLPSDGGSGFGGGLYAAGGAITLHQVSVTANYSTGGSGGKGQHHGNPGQAIGGGLYFDLNAWVGLDAFTESHTKHNHATIDSNIHGAYDVVL